MQKFVNPRDPENLHIKIWIEQQVRTILGEKVRKCSLIEIACQDCLHAETQLCVEWEDVIQYFKISKPLVFIRKADIVQGLKRSYLEKPVHHH